MDDYLLGKWTAALALAASVVCSSGCAGHPGKVVGARDNTQFARDDAPYFVMFMEGKRDTEIRTLRGEYVRTILSGSGAYDTDDRGVHVVGRDDDGAFRTVAGKGMLRLNLPIEWSANVVLNGSGTRIAATNGPGGRMRILSFDTGAILLDRECPAAASCFWIAWDLQEPDVVWFIAKTFDGYVRLNIESGESSHASRSNDLPIRLPTQNALSRPACKNSDVKLEITDDAIDLVATGQPPRRLVSLDGYKPAWPNDRYPPIGSAGFVEDCDYAVFRHRSDYYLVEIATGLIGRLPGVPLRSLRSVDVKNAAGD